LQQRVERLGFATTRDETFEQMRAVAAWTGDEERAAMLIAETRQQIADSIEQLAPLMTGSKAIFLSSNGIAFGAGTLQHDFLLSLGMTNVAADAGLYGPAPLALEKLVAAQPDFIFSEPRGALDRQLAHPLLQHPALANSAAIRIALRDRWFDCAGPWLADAYRNTAQQLLNR
jgi:ABC-type Fe3+-hydroxamate transport system substrate-binding protein